MDKKRVSRLTLRQLYEQAKRRDQERKTEAQKLINELCAITGKNECTVRSWLIGARVPNRETIGAIADHYGVDPEGLFAPAEK